MGLHLSSQVLQSNVEPTIPNPDPLGPTLSLRVPEVWDDIVVNQTLLVDDTVRVSATEDAMYQALSVAITSGTFAQSARDAFYQFQIADAFVRPKEMRSAHVDCGAALLLCTRRAITELTLGPASPLPLATTTAEEAATGFPVALLEDPFVLDLLLMHAAPRKETFLTPDDFGLMCTAVVRGAALLRMAFVKEDQEQSARAEEARKAAKERQEKAQAAKRAREAMLKDEKERLELYSKKSNKSQYQGLLAQIQIREKREKAEAKAAEEARAAKAAEKAEKRAARKAAQKAKFAQKEKEREARVAEGRCGCRCGL